MRSNWEEVRSQHKLDRQFGQLNSGHSAVVGGQQMKVALYKDTSGILIRILSPLRDVCGLGAMISQEILIPSYGNVCKIIDGGRSQ